MNKKIIWIIVFVALLAGISIYFTLNWTSPEIKKDTPSKFAISNEQQNQQEDTNEPPLKLKSIGVDFEDFRFTKQKLQFNRLFMGFGFVIPANISSSGKNKSNPQPTFILPLGTPVRSLVDGVVASMPILWSGDISIQVTTDGKLQKWVYEIEHVINPKVKVGDKVTAGQIIAEVGNFDKGTPDGYGVVEIGILHGGGEGPPEHICPFAYLDESIKEDTLKKITALFKTWEDYANDQSLYDESATVPGCLTLDPIEG